MKPECMQIGKVMVSILSMHVELDELSANLGEIVEEHVEALNAQLIKMGWEVGTLSRLIDPDARIETLIMDQVGDNWQRLLSL